MQKFMLYWAIPLSIVLMIGGLIADIEWINMIGYYLFLLYAVLRVTIWRSKSKSKNVFYILIIIIICILLLFKTEII